MNLSIIIPVLNEADCLEEALDQLQVLRAQGAEIIVVDGGSCDVSYKVACAAADKVKVCAAGRAAQMNCGAACAEGKYLLFLHVDTLLPVCDLPIFFPPEWLLLEEKNDHILSNKHVVTEQSRPSWGFFLLSIDNHRWQFRIIEWLINKRSTWTRVSTGDQCQFFQRDFFKQLGGFTDIALMEDVAISKLARDQAEPKIISSRVSTSSRRWCKHGILKTVCLMWAFRLSYWLGVDPNQLAAIYYPTSKK